MSDHFKDREHLVRMAGLFLAGIVGFVILRGLLIPKTFGEYGHYRGAALTEIMALPQHYAGRQACADCHADVVEARHGGKHERIGCEACHGPLATHATDPEQVKAVRPPVVPTCLRCHTDNVAKPAAFPQIDPRDHGDGEGCGSCHKPHNPKVS